jgi:hypothetical protein
VDHAEVVGRALLVARSNAPELFEPVDQAFDEIAAPVRSAVEVGLPTLVALARDHRPDVTPAQAAARGWAAVALVPGCALRPQTGPALAGSTNRSLVQQRFQRNLLMPLTAGQHRRDRPAIAFGPQMQLGREAALAAPQCLPGLRLTPR